MPTLPWPLTKVPEEIHIVREKVRTLASWLRLFKGSCIVHVGAGLSTSAGIPDFRGTTGVWTKLLRNKDSKNETWSETRIEYEKKDIKPEVSSDRNEMKPFDETVPTIGHLILRELCTRDFVDHIVSQNVDGLFLKSNLPRDYISELHGNFYLDECTTCRSRFIRSSASSTMRLQKSSIKCPRVDKQCKGHLRDTILDWESPIPYNELRLAQRKSRLNKLHICIGTSLQLRPSKDLVCDPKKNKGYKLVIINLQPTQFDKKADLVIHYFSDEVLKFLAHELDLDLPTYDAFQDPTKGLKLSDRQWRRS